MPLGWSMTSSSTGLSMPPRLQGLTKVQVFPIGVLALWIKCQRGCKAMGVCGGGGVDARLESLGVDRDLASRSCLDIMMVVLLNAAHGKPAWWSMSRS
mmetsp:Transcript_52392/g.137144  ORF Transcript_52392/g.137144 Transcript_52392/m.137144 type:complete len:98 (+) Transcript_52392:1291-1584(+)